MPDEKIADLIERVERLDGPDREIDALLHKAFIDPTVSFVRNVPENGGRFIGLTKGSAERYTASLDAVLSLVERVRPGWVPALEFGDPGADSTTMRSHIAKLRPNMRDDIGWQTSGVVRGSSLASMPLAVLSALLRSIQG